MQEAEEALRSAIAILVDMNQPLESHSQMNSFMAFLRNVTDDGRRLKRLAQGYDALQLEPIFEKEDIEAPDNEIPVVLPSRSHRILDTSDRPPFDPSEWDSSPNPDPLVVFDS
jgi:hypothetical protein